MEQPAPTKIEPKKEGELKGYFESSHSPFGFVWQIAEATGWTVDYIMWGVNYQTLLMMLADAPRYIDADQAANLSKDNNTKRNKQPKNPKPLLAFFKRKLNVDKGNRN